MRIGVDRSAWACRPTASPRRSCGDARGRATACHALHPAQRGAPCLVDLSLDLETAQLRPSRVPHRRDALTPWSALVPSALRGPPRAPYAHRNHERTQRTLNSILGRCRGTGSFSATDAAPVRPVWPPHASIPHGVTPHGSAAAGPHPRERTTRNAPRTRLKSEEDRVDRRRNRDVRVPCARRFVCAPHDADSTDAWSARLELACGAVSVSEARPKR